jgi:ABC-2 type transport system ATP-binding protein
MVFRRGRASLIGAEHGSQVGRFFAGDGEEHESDTGSTTDRSKGPAKAGSLSRLRPRAWVQAGHVDAIRAERLTKFYGRSRGVSELDLTVGNGEVFGFLGPNGAGKSTTIRLLLDLIRPSSGRIAVFGRDVRGAHELRRDVGYVPGDLVLYERLTGREHVRYFSALRGLKTLGDAEPLARRFELDLDRPARELSRGNRQKIGLVLAFMHRPKLLVLDEPTSGLDPLMQEAFNELVREVADEGRTVFLSSHQLAEVQRIADRVGIIREGRLQLVESVETLRRRAFVRMEVTFAEPPPAGAFDGLPGVRELERRGHVVLFAVEGEVDPLLKAISRFRVVALDSHEADLEDVFLNLYRGEDHRAD